MAIERKDAKSYLKMPYARVMTPEEEGGFSAEILEFPGCVADGETLDEAFANLEGVAEAWIDAALEQGQEIPPPLANHSYSGHFALRMPRDIHRMAARKAERDGVSVNQCLVTAITAWVGADNLFERIAHKVEMNFVQANFMITPISASGVSAFPHAWFLASDAAAIIPHMSKMVLSDTAKSATTTGFTTIGGRNG